MHPPNMQNIILTILITLSASDPQDNSQSELHVIRGLFSDEILTITHFLTNKLMILNLEMHIVIKNVISYPTNVQSEVPIYK